MNEPSLWPKNLDDTPPLEDIPRAILDHAAKEIGEITKDSVVGEIVRGGTGDRLELSFYLRATEVDYRYLLFKVRHTIDGFPVEFIDASGTKSKALEDRQAFEEELRQFFGTAPTRAVVNRLRNLAREVG